MPGTAASAGAEVADRAASLMAQLQRGFFWLRFDAEFEAAYRQDQFRERVRYLRASIAILVGLLLVLFQIDHGVMPDTSARLPLRARFGTMLPALAIGFALTFAGRAPVWYRAS